MRSNNGFSIVFVMAALVVSGFIGISLLQLSHSDKMSEVLYSNSESARISAHSGILSAVSNIGNGDSASIQGMLMRLNCYVNARNPDTLPDSLLWLHGSGSDWDTLSSTQFYKVKITGFEPETFEISLQGEGLGWGNSRASVVALYDLKGLARLSGTSSGAFPTYALQMDNGAFEFDVPLVVNGNTSVRKGMAVWDPAEFHGTFRCDTLIREDGSREIGIVELRNHGFVIDGPAYFAGEVGGGGAVMTFNNNAGFDGLFIFQPENVTYGEEVRYDTLSNSPLEIDTIHGPFNYIYAGGTNDVSTNTSYDLQKNNLEVYGIDTTYAPTGGMGAFFNYNGSTAIQSGSVNVAEKVGLSPIAPPKIYFDTSYLTTVHHIIDASPIYSKNRVTATDLNNLYETHKNNLLNGEFLVVKVTGKNTANGIFVNDGSVFTGKMVLWVNDGDNVIGEFVETSTTANLSIYIDSGSSESPHFTDVGYHRGYIYINKYKSVDFAFGGGGASEIAGGIYAGEKASLFLHGTGVRTVSYDAGVIRELANLGIFNNPDDSSVSVVSTIVLDSNATRIRPELLSHVL